MRAGGRHMSGSEAGKSEKSPCSVKNMPVPEVTACPKCGEEIEVWSDDEEITCRACGHTVARKK